ncbi:N-acetyltransferase [Novosphingobium sp. AAP93]|uniref:GNAT family N-acetyltransferase n=1 Tax=Novosphingobium sp. AAP93 TaxID=1523427 RepID=UPI0006B92033|nr:GNAT family N-acetyltransferase [Novosphingobium sp. AAP93]KPF83122.1 GNAT family acetyltransferase [Novosphingobium sp. AAP93]
MALVLKAPGAADRAAWEHLWQGYQRFYNVEIPARVSDLTWARLHDPAEPMWACLAWQGARAIGMVHWIYHRSTWTDGPYCYLQDLYVDEDVRGTGAGRALIAHVRTEAEAARASRLYWLTHETNTDAMQLYDKVATRSGFVQYRVVL